MCLSIAINRPNDVLAKGEHLGYQWMVVHNGIGYRCGYVRVPLGHPWHGKDDWDWDEVERVDVHGGITFAEADVPCDAPGPDTDWWLGFDCAHGFDAPDPALLQNPLITPSPWGKSVVRTQSYVEDECRSLCRQAAIADELDGATTTSENVLDR
jgi:hypothetical protein